MKEEQILKDKIKGLEQERKKTLVNYKFISDSSLSQQSYGKFDDFARDINNDFDQRILVEQEKLDKLIGVVHNNKPTSNRGEKHHSKEKENNNSQRQQLHKDESNDEVDESAAGVDDSSRSSEGRSDSDSSQLGRGKENVRQRRRNNQQRKRGPAVDSNNQTKESPIEIDLSDSDSDSDSDFIQPEFDANSCSSAHSEGDSAESSGTPDDEMHDENRPKKRNREEQGEDIERGGEDNPTAPGNNSRDEESEDIDEGEDGDSEDDGDDSSGEIQRYHVSNIKDSPLTMMAQGFRCREGRLKGPASTTNAKNTTSFDPDSVKYRGRTFHKNRCYNYSTSNGVITVVGIQYFLSKDTARVILIARFEDTLLGTEDGGVEYKADCVGSSHVQVYGHTDDIQLSKLDGESPDVQEIPDLIYEPQTTGCWNTFGYFLDPCKMKRKGRRKELRSLEVFAGAGGSMLGYHINGFKTVMAIEKDTDSILTLKRNNEDLPIFEGCVKEFIKNFDILRPALGRIDHIQFSSPCQDFSKANRSQNTTSGRRDRAELSLLIIKLIQITSCSTAVFENVKGIWQRRNIYYLKTIAKELLKMGYQMRCKTLHACDYGDPQTRPRVIMFISKMSVPIPSFPAKTHGTEGDLWPYLTVKTAFTNLFSDPSTPPDTRGSSTRLKPGDHGTVRLHANDVAPTIRASSTHTFHCDEDRPINLGEAACLQSFPPGYKFCGTMRSQYRQIGNAVPVELSTAVAQSVRQVLLYEYL